MKTIGDLFGHCVSVTVMRFLASIGVLCGFVSYAYAQSGPPSAALDSNYVILQPTEAFKGRWANTFVGQVLDNVGPMTPGSEYGDIFINALDSLGYGADVSIRQPLGLFQGGPEFSLLNRAKLILDGTSTAVKVFSRGRHALPLLIENSSYFHIRYPNGPYLYDTANFVFLASAAVNGKITYPVASSWSIGSGYMNTDSMEDIVIVEPLNADSSLAVLIWEGQDLEYKGDTVTVGPNGLYHIVKTRRMFKLSGTIAQYTKASIADMNHDGVPDIVFQEDSIDEFDRHHAPSHLCIVFGTRDVGGEWEVDTTIRYRTPYTVKTYLFMDFLWSDNIPDLLLQSADTIYCYSGASKDFLRTPPDWLHPDLAIPNPEMLDTVNFKGNGKGDFTWVKLCDAGSFNESGAHCLAVLGSYTPDLNGNLGTSYCMFYSGGRAADEKADAFFADNSASDGYFQHVDTIQTSTTGPMNVVIDDPWYDNGGVGRLYFVKGSRDIPHRADPRWSSTVSNRQYPEERKVTLLTNPIARIATVVLSGDPWTDGLLVVRDLLGRSIITQRVDASGEPLQLMQIDLSSIPAGVYIIEFSQDHVRTTARAVVTH